MEQSLTKKTHNPLNQQSNRKPAPTKGYSLKRPIDGYRVVVPGGLYCPNPCLLQFNLVCGSYSVELFDVEGLKNKFETFVTTWLYTDQKMTRVHSVKYRRVLDMLLANLRWAHLEGRQLLTPLRKGKITSDNPAKLKQHTIIQTINFLADHGWIRLVKGVVHEYGGACTWCEPSPALISEFENHNLRAQLHDDAALVEIRIKKTAGGKSVPKPAPLRDRKQVERLAVTVRDFNLLWLTHMPTLDGNWVMPFCRRLFNDSLQYGGRFYGWYQRLTKEERGRIKIDGVRTIEPDYSGYHIHILYANAGLPLENEPYEIPGYERDTVKAVMLPLLNSENLNQLAGQINKSARADMQKYHRQWEQKSKDHYLKRAQHIRVGKLEKPDYLKGFIDGIPEGTNGYDLITAIKQKHPAVAHNFGSPRIGVKLQKQDSDIMAAVLDKLTVQGIPALPVHDSIRIKITDASYTVEAMKTEYKRITGFDIVVK